jgi:hypothetical protein
VSQLEVNEYQRASEGSLKLVDLDEIFASVERWEGCRTPLGGDVIEDVPELLRDRVVVGPVFFVGG